VRIQKVTINNRRKAFEVSMAGRPPLLFPFAQLEIPPTTADPVKNVYVDPELGAAGFTYVLESGKEASVHGDDVLEYHEDPGYLRDLTLYQLTLEAQKRIERARLPKREIIRRLGTSPTQLYRLLDQTNYRKSIDQMLRLLQVLDCDVQLVVREKTAPYDRSRRHHTSRTGQVVVLEARAGRSRGKASASRHPHRSPVPSRSVASVGYSESTRTLAIEFRNGSIYEYFDVPRAVYHALLKSTSLGRYVNVNIRNVYRYVQR
jgi:hypothetical protein